MLVESCSRQHKRSTKCSSCPKCPSCRSRRYAPIIVFAQHRSGHTQYVGRDAHELRWEKKPLPGTVQVVGQAEGRLVHASSQGTRMPSHSFSHRHLRCHKLGRENRAQGLCSLSPTEWTHLHHEHALASKCMPSSLLSRKSPVTPQPRPSKRDRRLLQRRSFRGQARLKVAKPSNSVTGNHPSHRSDTPNTVIYDASFSRNAQYAVPVIVQNKTKQK